MIWDAHTHLHGVDGRTPEERMARLLRFADRIGIERVCVFMGFPFLADPTPDQLREQNDQVLAAPSHHHDRAFEFVYLSPHHPEASLREFDRCVKDGPMVGAKLWAARPWSRSCARGRCASTSRCKRASAWSAGWSNGSGPTACYSARTSRCSSPRRRC